MRVRDEIEVPDALAEAVRLAAAACPATLADLAGLRGLRRRYQRRRHRRVAVTAGLAAVFVGAGAVAGPMLGGVGDRRAPSGGTADLSEPAGPASPTPAPAPPAQRLLLSMGGMTMGPSNGGPEVGLMLGGKGIPELLPDGRVRYHPVSGVDGIHGVIALPDGRLVTTGYVDLTPHVTGRTDGPWVPGLEFKLIVQRADGSVELSHDIRVMGENVTLVGATAREAYLLRPRGLFAHDYATGQERLAVPARSIPNGPEGAPGGAGLSIAAGRLAVALDEPSPCAVQVLDLATADPIIRIPLSSLGCFSVGGVYLSPDGRHVAVTYGVLTPDRTEFLANRLAILDVAGGAVRHDRLLSRFEKYVKFQPKMIPGMAWSDAHTLRIAQVDMPAEPVRVYHVEEVLATELVTIS